jgi:hypothetical protein
VCHTVNLKPEGMEALIHVYTNSQRIGPRLNDLYTGILRR